MEGGCVEVLAEGDNRSRQADEVNIQKTEEMKPDYASPQSYSAKKSKYHKWI